MSLLIALILGLAVGVAGGLLLQANLDLLFLTILSGIVGAIIGGAVYFLSAGDQTYLLFSWAGTLTSLVGALVCVVGFSALNRPK